MTQTDLQKALKNLVGKECNYHSGTYDNLGRCYDCMQNEEIIHCHSCETGNCEGDLSLSHNCCYCNENEFEDSCKPCQNRMH